MKQQRDAQHAIIATGGERLLPYQTAKSLKLTWTELPKDLEKSWVRTTSEDTWIRQDLGEWRAMLRIVPSANGNPVAAEIRVFPQESDAARRAAQLAPEEWSGCYLGARAVVPGGGLTARKLDAVRIGEAISQGTRQLQQRLDANLSGVWSTFWPTRPGPRPRRGGRQPVSDDQLVSVAYAYAYACQKEHKAPVQFTAKHHHITRDRARDWLRTARDRDILPNCDNTRPVGELTEKGLRLWREYTARTAVQTKGGRRR